MKITLPKLTERRWAINRLIFCQGSTVTTFVSFNDIEIMKKFNISDADIAKEIANNSCTNQEAWEGDDGEGE